MSDNAVHYSRKWFVTALPCVTITNHHNRHLTITIAILTITIAIVTITSAIVTITVVTNTIAIVTITVQVVK